MRVKATSRRTLAIASLLATIVGATCVAAIAMAGADERVMSGGFVSGPPFDGPDCPSPIDLCATAEFTGTVHGPATAVATSLTPTAEPGVVVGVADIVIHDPRGNLECTDFTNAAGHIEAFGSAAVARTSADDTAAS